MILQDMSIRIRAALRNRKTSSRLRRMTTVSKVEEYRDRMARDADRAQAPIIKALRKGMPQKDVAALFDLSKQRVSQIKARAIERGLLPPDPSAD